MNLLLGAIAIVLALSALLMVFVRTEPRKLAQGIRIVGPVTLGTVGLALILLGRAGVGGIFISGALAWLGSNQFAKPKVKSPGKRSTVRTAALEMELDHDTGGLEGLVLVGRHENKMLGRMGQTELVELYGELASDSESLQLLETYLDSRFPAWRENLKADARAGQGVSPGSGAMTKEEAYKVLGLEAGASAADVRQAHRRLMQRLHPDIGGSPFLAARINEAKDVLLSDHS